MPVILVSACGGTTLTHGGDAGEGGAEQGGAEQGGAEQGGAEQGGAGGAGAGESGGHSAGGAVQSSGGKTGRGGVAGSGGASSREPMQHRATPTTCGTPSPQPGSGGSSAGASPDEETCKLDSDCTMGKDGRCINGRIGLHCTYNACFADAECGDGQVCLCEGGMGSGSRCSVPGCRIDADCPGSWCSPSFGTCGNYSGVIGYQCHGPKDECVDDTDCGDGSFSAPYCAYDPMVAHWVCSASQCVG